MLLVNFLDDLADSKQLLKTIKKYKVDNILFVHFKNCLSPNILSKESEDIDDTSTSKKLETKEFLFKMLDSMKFNYEYLDIVSNITHITLIGLLASKIVSYRNEAVINLTYCPKTYVPIVVQAAYYIPQFIKEILLFTEDFGSTAISYPIASIDYDPDKETNLLKEILSLFLTNQTYYTDFAFNKTLSSTIILQLVNDEQAVKSQKEFKYPYIQACLSNLAQNQNGKPILLQRRHNSSDKTALVYTITDHGVLALLIWYLQQKQADNTKTPLYTKLHEIFKDISFSEIEYRYISSSKICTICESGNVSELFTCSICGQESCKECLNDQFLDNKCHVQLQIIS